MEIYTFLIILWKATNGQIDDPINETNNRMMDIIKIIQCDKKEKNSRIFVYVKL